MTFAVAMSQLAAILIMILLWSVTAFMIAGTAFLYFEGRSLMAMRWLQRTLKNLLRASFVTTIVVAIALVAHFAS